MLISTLTSIRFRSGPRGRLLATVIATSLGSSVTFAEARAPYVEASADPAFAEFSSAFTGDASVDLARFSVRDAVLPGSYNVDIAINGTVITRRTMEFRSDAASRDVRPCLVRHDLELMEVDMTQVASTLDAEDCVDLASVVPHAQTLFDLANLRLDVSIPQAYLRRKARGYVDPADWDEGETAFLVGYNFNSYTSRQPSFAGSSLEPADPAQSQHPAPDSWGRSPHGRSHTTDTRGYLGLDLGLNAGGWRLRSVETAQWQSSSKRLSLNTLSATAEHDIDRLKAQLTLGDGYTQGRLFESTAFRGASLYSDDRMLPDSQRGFAPTVRGFANSQARVEIRQGGNLLHATTVAPGPFVIDDLYATGYAGDLDVTIIEADGSSRRFVVPYASVPALLRPSTDRWAVTAGRVRLGGAGSKAPRFAEASYQRGITNWLTLFGGAQVADRMGYSALLAGAAVNTPAGAFSLDVTRSRGRKGGYSTRLSYAKTLPATDTTLALASYRYSSAGFASLNDIAAAGRERPHHGPIVSSSASTRHRMQVTLNQGFGDRRGQLFVTVSRDSYWDGRSSAATYQMGYSNSVGPATVSVTASRTRLSDWRGHAGRSDNQWSVNVSMPLGRAASARASRLSLASAGSGSQGQSNRLGLSGLFGDRKQYSYSAGMSQSGSAKANGNGNLGWQAAYGSLSTGYAWAKDYQQMSFGATGGIVVHEGGITLAPQMSLNTPIALVHADGAEGARLSGASQAAIDARGYGIATGLTPYRLNDVSIDPAGTSMDVELKTTRMQTSPRAGAVVLLPFEAVSGRPVILNAVDEAGQPLSFGADVRSIDGNSLGMVGQGGQIFMRGEEMGGSIVVDSGAAAGNVCRIDYQLAARDKNGTRSIESQDVVCRKEGG